MKVWIEVCEDEGGKKDAIGHDFTNATDDTIRKCMAEIAEMMVKRRAGLQGEHDASATLRMAINYTEEGSSARMTDESREQIADAIRVALAAPNGDPSKVSVDVDPNMPCVPDHVRVVFKVSVSFATGDE